MSKENNNTLKQRAMTQFESTKGNMKIDGNKLMLIDKLGGYHFGRLDEKGYVVTRSGLSLSYLYEEAREDSSRTFQDRRQHQDHSKQKGRVV